MGGHDYCAVFGCQNARHKPEKHIVKDHVANLRWHRPNNQQDQKAWEKQINRKGFKMSKWTVVCSNHFQAGYYSNVCNIPTLYMKGYDVSQPEKRKEPTERSTFENPKKRSRNIMRDGADIEIVEIPTQTPPVGDHDYDVQTIKETCSRCIGYNHCHSCTSKTKTIVEMMSRLQEQAETINDLKNEKFALEKKHFGISEVKNSDRMITIHTGLQNFRVFDWLFKRIEPKARMLHYVTRKKKESGSSSRGPKRKLTIEDEFFLTLLRLRLGLTEIDIACRFKISQSTVSSILQTWIPFLAREFEVFIHWPTKEQARQSLPKCFEKFPNTIGIIDCTEGAIEKPSMAKAQAQTYSSYKSKNTWKKLLCIAPCGTISFISMAYGGSASDRFITENCQLLDKVKPGDTIMADKGFNIGDLLVGKGAKLVVPPFLKDKVRFSRENCTKTANIAKARIHVERAIARIKDFKILQGAIPITMKDMLDDIFIIICAITNLAPPLL